MKILHVCTPSNYGVTKPFIRFVNSEFDPKNHEFLIMDKYSNVPIELKELDNVIAVQANNIVQFRILMEKMYTFDKILLHSLNKTFFQALILFNSRLIKKIYWISWGADLYQWKSNKKNLKYFVRNIIAYKTRMKILNFVGIFPPDIEYFKKEFKSNAKTFYASYTGNLYNPLYSKNEVFTKLEDKFKRNKCINIQVGHSSTKTLNHIEVLKRLEKFKDKSIKIYLPLSYGDMEYADLVEENAKNLFGNKAICIREMMPKEDYMEYLSTIDIAIFNTNRQIGLGNISPMLYMEKKIYMPKNSVMYNFYKSQQVDIWDYNEIANFDFDKFMQPLRFKGGQKYIVENELDLAHKIDMWNKVFEDPLKRGI